MMLARAEGFLYFKPSALHTLYLQDSVSSSQHLSKEIEWYQTMQDVPKKLF